jgi:hypothetical protein
MQIIIKIVCKNCSKAQAAVVLIALVLKAKNLAKQESPQAAVSWLHSHASSEITGTQGQLLVHSIEM